MLVWFGRKRQRRPFTVSLQMWEMAALRWVGVNRAVLVSLLLSTSTSFPSCLTAAKIHKPVLTEANYSSLHLLQTGWNSSGIQHLGTQRHLHISPLLHTKTNWFTIKTHWVLDNSSKLWSLAMSQPTKGYWWSNLLKRHKPINTKAGICMCMWVCIKAFLSCS